MTNPANLVELADSLDQAKILCVGDVMLDYFRTGDVSRISPEAPIPVLKLESQTAMLGGAGNVARNVTALGGACHLIAVCGDDAEGADVGALIAEAGIDGTPQTDPTRPTSVKTRYLAAGQQILRADRESTAPLNAQARQHLASAAQTALTDCAVVVLSDYGKGVLANGFEAELIAQARAAGKAVIVDPKGADYSRYRGASVVTPNRNELAQATGLPTDTDKNVIVAAQKVISQCGVNAVLVTRSKDGMTLVVDASDGGTKVTHLRAAAREVFDVSGAGDTVVATLASCLASGANLIDAATIANTAAGIVVSKVGTAVVTTGDLVGALHHRQLNAAEHHTVRLPAALDQVARWKQTGLTVGFTNGCFDLVHPGHISLLSQARAACDRLIVGLNSDASVSRLKGPSRPIQSETARATVLASLSMVDLVVIFADDTPLGLIEALRPDILVKGADYTVDQVVGADVVHSYGGKVVLARLEDGHSTTATLKRMGP